MKTTKIEFSTAELEKAIIGFSDAIDNFRIVLGKQFLPEFESIGRNIVIGIEKGFIKYWLTPFQVQMILLVVFVLLVMILSV